MSSDIVTDRLRIARDWARRDRELDTDRLTESNLRPDTTVVAVRHDESAGDVFGRCQAHEPPVLIVIGLENRAIGQMLVAPASDAEVAARKMDSVDPASQIGMLYELTRQRKHFSFQLTRWSQPVTMDDLTLA